MEFTSSGSSKRAKAPIGNVGVNVSCVVDGCNADLSQCREYHRRHKVCERHTKTPKVMIAGREQRFCQQCSRFHSLVEFDEGKRSCRKRLEGHNRRRRKPQPDPTHRSSGMLLSNQPGTTILSFDSPQVHQSAMASSAWPGAVKTKNDTIVFNNHASSNYIDSSTAHNSYKGVNQFHFLQGTDRNNQAKVSDRALSLLSASSSTAPFTQTSEVGSSQMVQPNMYSRPQHLLHHLQFGGPGQYSTFAREMESEVSNGSDRITSLPFQGNFLNGHGSSTSGTQTQQTLSFIWD